MGENGNSRAEKNNATNCGQGRGCVDKEREKIKSATLKAGIKSAYSLKNWGFF